MVCFLDVHRRGEANVVCGNQDVQEREAAVSRLFIGEGEAELFGEPLLEVSTSSKFRTLTKMSST